MKHLLLLMIILLVGCSFKLPEVGPVVEATELAQLREGLERAGLQLTEVANDMATKQVLISTMEAALATQRAPTPEPTAAPPTPTMVEPEVTPELSASTSGAFIADFGFDLGYFFIPPGAEVREGSLWMGPFESCVEFNNKHPVGCVAVCTECGAETAEFRFATEVRFSGGNSERFFGVALRFDDLDGNLLIDADDYFLGWAFSPFKGEWAVYEHAPGAFPTWQTKASGQANLPFVATRASTIEVFGLDEGRAIHVWMNGIRLVRLANEGAETGEVVLPAMPAAGALGLWVVQGGVEAAFDTAIFDSAVGEQ